MTLNIPSAPVYGVYVSQLIRYARSCSNYLDFRSKSARRFVVCLSVCHFVLVFFSPFSIAITSLGEERANLSAFRTFVRFVLV